MKNSNIAKALRELSLNVSQEAEGDILAKTEAGDTTQADAPGEDAEVKTVIVEVKDSPEAETAETEVTAEAEEPACAIEGTETETEGKVDAIEGAETEATDSEVVSAEGLKDVFQRLTNRKVRIEHRIAQTEEMLKEAKAEVAKYTKELTEVKKTGDAGHIEGVELDLNEAKTDVKDAEEALAEDRQKLKELNAKVAVSKECRDDETAAGEELVPTAVVEAAEETPVEAAPVEAAAPAEITIEAPAAEEVNVEVAAPEAAAEEVAVEVTEEAPVAEEIVAAPEAAEEFQIEATEEDEAAEQEVEAAEETVDALREHVEQYEQSEAALESLIDALENAQRNGGLTPQSAQFFNIAFESIGTSLTGAPFKNEAGESPVPSMEAYGGTMRRDEATGSALDTAKDWIKKIIEVIKKAWAKIVEWVKNFALAVATQAGRLKSRSEGIRKQAATLTQDKGGTFVFSGAGKIAVEKKVDVRALGNVANVVKKSTEVTAEGKRLSEHVSSLIEQLVAAANQGQASEETFDSFKYFFGVSADMFRNKATEGLYTERTTNGPFVSFSTPVLPGNVRLVKTLPVTEAPAKEDSNAAIDQVVAVIHGVGRTKVERNEVELSENDKTVPVLSKSQIQAVCDEVDAIIKNVQDTARFLKLYKHHMNLNLVQVDAGVTALQRYRINRLSKTAIQYLADQSGGITKALKYSTGVCSSFLDYASESLKIQQKA